MKASTFKHKNATIVGYSRAGDATGFYVPELNICLDAGTAIHQQKPQKLFISHTHSDHSFQVPYLYGRFTEKTMNKSIPTLQSMEKTTTTTTTALSTTKTKSISNVITSSKLDIYVPKTCQQLLFHYLQSAQNLNDCCENAEQKFNITGVEHGDEWTMKLCKRDITVEVCECFHTVPCVGYLFYEMRKKLKEEFKDLTGKEIANMKKRLKEQDPKLDHGMFMDSIMVDSKVPLFAFLGDSTPKVFHIYGSKLFAFPLILCECTFLHGTQEDSKGHTYFQALKPFIEKNPNTTFLLFHFSRSLKSCEIEQFFKEQNLSNAIPFL